MLENISLNIKLDKTEYKRIKDEAVTKLGALQRRARTLGIPVMIIFEGWDASGKGTVINEMTVPLDPRNLVVYSGRKSLSDDEIKRPFLWRYWTKTPGKGQIVIFDEAYYSELVKSDEDEEASTIHYKEISEFEKTLADSGIVIIKFFMHISKKEQKKRFKKLEEDEATSWRVTTSDWKQNKKYDSRLKDFDRMLEMTDKENAHWNVVEGTDRRFAAVKVMNIVSKMLEDAINQAENVPKPERHPLISTGDDPFRSSILEGVDMDQSLDKETYHRELKKYQKKLHLLEYEIYRKRIPVIIGFEGWDAGGKGGAIKRLCSNLDPRGYRVFPTSAPTKDELAHNWLCRFWKNVPKQGHIAIFDRTWYGRVMVEPIEGFCTRDEYDRAFSEINTFERQLLEYGAVIVKFWMNITKDEQEKRFQKRQQNPDKQWKITDEDWRNREKWDQYLVAVDRMLLKTSTKDAPWTIVEGNDKFFARVKVLKTVVEAIEKKLDE